MTELARERVDTGFSCQPAFLLTKNPFEWRLASLPKLQAGLSSEAPLSAEKLASFQEQKWQNLTGVFPRDSSFTLIMPIHNEERSLTSSLGTLMLADIPVSVPVDILLITNDCSDASEEIVRDFLGKLGDMHEATLPDNLSDQQLERVAEYVQVGGIRFVQITTKTRGKANALTVGNELARHKGNKIAMSLDANNYIEPDAIQHMFCQAHRLFVREADGTVLFHTKMKGVRNPTPLLSLLLKGKKVVSEGVDMKESVYGPLMAWDTDWLSQIGGVPATASEDYALGYMARRGGFKVRHSEGVELWGNIPNSLVEIQDTRARMIRGALQLIALDSAAQEELGQQFFMQNFPSRISRFIDRTKTKPYALPLHAVNFLLWEHARWKAVRDFASDPTNMSWAPIHSTK